MPDNKNQHYVPRCRLKPFTLNGEGRSINLFNLARERAIPNAPVKNQCSRDYFYGDDLQAEMLLANLEGRFAAVSDKLLVGAAPNAEDAHWLKVFALIQWRRTRGQLAEMRQAWRMWAYARDLSQKPDDLDNRELLGILMRAGARAIEHVRDLKVAIFRSRAGSEFIISDNPSVLTNRMHLQRMRDNRFGLSSPGAMFVLPLAPSPAMIAYDGACYTIDKNADGFVEAKDRDVEVFNEFQFLLAQKNVYYGPNASAHGLADAAKYAAAEMEECRPTTRTFVPLESSSDTFRLSKPGEELTERKMLLETAFRHPSPSGWPSKLKLREKVKYLGDGTLRGPVRRTEWLKKRSARR